MGGETELTAARRRGAGVKNVFLNPSASRSLSYGVAASPKTHKSFLQMLSSTECAASTPPGPAFSVTYTENKLHWCSEGEDVKGKIFPYSSVLEFLLWEKEQMPFYGI